MLYYICCPIYKIRKVKTVCDLYIFIFRIVVISSIQYDVTWKNHLKWQLQKNNELLTMNHNKAIQNHMNTIIPRYHCSSQCASFPFLHRNQQQRGGDSWWQNGSELIMWLASRSHDSHKCHMMISSGSCYKHIDWFTWLFLNSFKSRDLKTGWKSSSSCDHTSDNKSHDQHPESLVFLMEVGWRERFMPIPFCRESSGVLLRRPWGRPSVLRLTADRGVPAGGRGYCRSYMHPQIT